MANCIHAHNTVQLKLQNMGPDRSQLDSPAVCVIAQHYSSAIFVSLCSHSHKEIFGKGFKLTSFLVRAQNTEK